MSKAPLIGAVADDIVGSVRVFPENSPEFKAAQAQVQARLARTKTAAVFIETWKLAVFEKHLKAAGYSYEVTDGLTPGQYNLRVKYEWVAELKPIIEAAQAEARKHGR